MPHRFLVVAALVLVHNVIVMRVTAPGGLAVITYEAVGYQLLEDRDRCPDLLEKLGLSWGEMFGRVALQGRPNELQASGARAGRLGYGGGPETPLKGLDAPLKRSVYPVQLRPPANGPRAAPTLPGEP